MEKTISNIALIGASANKSKYGYIILKDLIKKGYTVFPVHPALDEIDGIPVFKSTNDLQTEPDLFVFVVPPEVGLNVTKELYNKGFRKFWYQPGAESDEISGFLSKDDKVRFSAFKCIMVTTNKAGDLSF